MTIKLNTASAAMRAVIVLVLVPIWFVAGFFLWIPQIAWAYIGFFASFIASIMSRNDVDNIEITSVERSVKYYGDGFAGIWSFFFEENGIGIDIRGLTLRVIFAVLFWPSALFFLVMAVELNK